MYFIYIFLLPRPSSFFPFLRRQGVKFYPQISLIIINIAIYYLYSESLWHPQKKKTPNYTQQSCGQKKNLCIDNLAQTLNRWYSHHRNRTEYSHHHRNRTCSLSNNLSFCSLIGLSPVSNFWSSAARGKILMNDFSFCQLLVVGSRTDWFALLGF